ncbi:MAG: hypothetical protein MUP47_00070 [Phycisphaerae bacterium]|nr:hypothetical protein [Phycisphaerae bacterium]
MRPIPRSKHTPAVVVLLAVAALYGGLATTDSSLDDRQITLATAALSASDGGLFPADPLFGPKGPVFSPSPAFAGAMRLMLPVTGGDPIRLLRLLVGPMVLLYLLGMYALLLRQCRSWSVAAFVAILSTVVIEAMGGTTWGLGTLASAGPSGLALAATPWLVLGLLDALNRPSGRWRLAAVFLGVGLLGHFDLSWALNMAIILSATYLIQRRLVPMAWLAAAACLVLAAAAAIPPLVQCARTRLGPPASQEAVQAVWRTLREGDHALLYPQAWRALPDWLVWVLPLAIPMLVTLWQVDRFRAPFLGFWATFAASAVIVATVLQVTSQCIGRVAHAPPPVLGFVRASCLLMVPLYALFAQALTSLFRLTVGHHGLMRTACALAAAAWMIPSDNLAPARHLAYTGASVLLSEEHQPRRIRQLQESASRHAELEALARWAATNTPTDAVFLIDQSYFRVLSRRTIVAGDADGDYLSCARPEDLLDWRQRLTRQAHLLRPGAGKTDPAAIGQFITDLSSRRSFALGGAWYAVLSPLAAPEGGAMLTEVTSDQWGRFYRLYQIK